jgi:DNA mismatch repair ATPase MutS
MVKIHKYLQVVRQYLENTIHRMNNYLVYSNKLHTHTHFNKNICEQINTLNEYKTKLGRITDYTFNNYHKITEIGHTLKTFYELYDNKIYNDSFLYSFGFNGYVDCLEGLICNIKENKINICGFTNNKKSVLHKSYYGPLKNKHHVKNTIKFNKNITITGPNASGKTTVLKSTIINLIFSQQFGCGFYDSAKINPYKHIHCYLNIPDTSGRDSLFQAEARRCKAIIDSVNNNPHDTHFCIFDELYSGTNPEEAVLSAKSFMEYLMKNKNVSCLLTTHFVSLCEKLQYNKQVKNYHMHSTITNETIHYSYLLKKGISRVKGGIHVLSDMNYPQEIIDNSK